MNDANGLVMGLIKRTKTKVCGWGVELRRKECGEHIMNLVFECFVKGLDFGARGEESDSICIKK